MRRLYTAAAVPGCLLTSHLAAYHAVKNTSGSAQVEAPCQGKETQVYSDLKLSPGTCCHSLDMCGTGSTSEPTDQRMPKLGSVLHNLRMHSSSSATGKQFADPTTKARLLQTKKEQTGTRLSCRKHGLALPLFSRAG